ncbi:MAG TPA: PqqD family protein [Gemmatimonadaceae bacterium]|nr:PqqD family protein [Gemmatimonadaceae bacterium]
MLCTYLGDEAVLLHVGTKRYYRLNATGADIWRAIVSGRSRAQIVEEICAAYDVPANVARAQVTDLLDILAARKLLTLSNAD